MEHLRTSEPPEVIRRSSYEETKKGHPRLLGLIRRGTSEAREGKGMQEEAQGERNISEIPEKGN